jgi:hypothetical protein
VFDLAADASQYMWVWVRLRVCGVLQEQPIRLLGNGERLWEGRFGPESQGIMLRVRKRVSATSRWRLRIGVEVNVSPELRNQIAAIDSRIPTIGFERLIVVPEGDISARLDVLSKYVMSRQ